MPRKTDRDLTCSSSRSQFAAKRRRLAIAIKTVKAFTIQVAGERMHIPADVTSNIEHERAGVARELEFQLLWTVNDR